MDCVSAPETMGAPRRRRTTVSADDCLPANGWMEVAKGGGAGGDGGGGWKAARVAETVRAVILSHAIVLLCGVIFGVAVALSAVTVLGARRAGDMEGRRLAYGRALGNGVDASGAAGVDAAVRASGAASAQKAVVVAHAQEATVVQPVEDGATKGGDDDAPSMAEQSRHNATILEEYVQYHEMFHDLPRYTDPNDRHHGDVDVSTRPSSLYIIIWHAL